MTHVELSLTESSLPMQVVSAADPDHPLRRWALAVSLAMEPCVLLNSAGVVIAVSPACQPFLAVDRPTRSVSA